VTDSTTTAAFVTGGHPYDVVSVGDGLRALRGVETYVQSLPDLVVNQDGHRAAYDAVVFYNFHGKGYAVNLTDDLRESVPATLHDLGDRGVGVVVLHHGLPAFPDWAEWDDLVGIADREVTPHFDETVPVEPREHPITAGVEPWEMTDETYEMGEPDEESEVFLTTDNPQSMTALGWTRAYRESRVVCLQSGHGAGAFGHSSFRRVLGRAIQWSAGHL
jgi:type 1 glutamine amidotransferase